MTWSWRRRARLYLCADDPPVVCVNSRRIRRPCAFFQPKDAYLIGGGFGFQRVPAAEGQNPPSGAIVYYWLLG